MNTLKNLLNHERYQSIAVLLCIALLIWFWGCESKVASLTSPGTQVTRSELKIELDTILASAEYRYAQLDQQDKLKQMLIEHALLIGQTGTFNPYGLLAMLAGTIGIGATVDNVRKRVEIKKLNADK